MSIIAEFSSGVLTIECLIYLINIPHLSTLTRKEILENPDQIKQTDIAA